MRKQISKPLLSIFQLEKKKRNKQSDDGNEKNDSRRRDKTAVVLHGGKSQMIGGETELCR
jgi:hypothetical protein